MSARVKSAWSIATKIDRKQIALEQLSDMIGFRVIVPTVADCYRTLGHRPHQLEGRARALQGLYLGPQAQ